MNTEWILRATGHPRFPYRVTVVRGTEVLLDLLVQDRWPGTKGNIFCVRADPSAAMAPQEELERVPVRNFASYGKRLTVVLDRPNRKRCSFLLLSRSYKTKAGEYEQIFWQTQQGLTARRPRYKLAYNKPGSLTVYVDTLEKYAWNFPGATTVREKLPAGDYAIKDANGFLAVIERKTFANLMAELGNLKRFHQHLAELSACRHAALAVEAEYGDFLEPAKIRPYTGAFAAKAIAEIQACHPHLPLVFAGSRKAAAVWAMHYFRTVDERSREQAGGPDLVRESAARYGEARDRTFAQDDVRRLVLTRLPGTFTTRELIGNLPQLTPAAVRRELERLKHEGLLSAARRGRDLVWSRTDRPVVLMK